MICIKCGTENKETSIFCRNCGAELPKRNVSPIKRKQFCIYCGTEMVPGAEFCSNCGMKRGEVAPERSNALSEKIVKGEDPSISEGRNTVLLTEPDTIVDGMESEATIVIPKVNDSSAINPAGTETQSIFDEEQLSRDPADYMDLRQQKYVERTEIGKWPDPDVPAPRFGYPEPIVDPGAGWNENRLEETEQQWRYPDQDRELEEETFQQPYADPQNAYRVHSSVEPVLPEENTPLAPMQYLGWIVIYTLVPFGIVAAFIHAFGSGTKNINLKNFAKGCLIYWGIVVLITIIVYALVPGVIHSY